MKNTSLKLILVLLAVVLLLSLVACNTNDTPADGNTPDDGNQTNPPAGDENTDGIDWDNLPLKGLALIYENKARFQIVYASDAGSTAIREANNLVDRLRELGVDVADPISDKDASAVTDCEIIFGANVRNRSANLTVSDKYLGERGKTIKVVGNSIVVAGGSTNQLKSVISRFISAVLGIKSSTKALSELAVDPEFFEESLTEYSITSVKIGKNNLRDYVVVEDFTEYEGELGYFGDVRDFRDELYKHTGIWLEYGNLADIDTYEHKIVFKYTQDTVEDGFTAYVENGDLYLECAYANAFDRAYKKVMTDLIFGKNDDVLISASYTYTDDVAYAHYEDFGAKGDGVTNDYDAIYETHIYANEGGQTVLGKEGAVYYIDTLPKSVPVRTNVDFRGATFRINDVGSANYVTRQNVMFELARDYSAVTYGEAAIAEMGGGEPITIDYDDRSFPWLAPYLTAKSLVIVTNKNHRDFIRHGANQNSGNQRHDVFVVNTDGSLEEDSVVCFDFKEVTKIEVYRADDAPITVKNGTFVNICCRAVADTDFKNKYHAYYRGFRLMRANSTLENITHTIEGEPDLDLDYDSKFGRRNESYPYYGFLCISNCYNLTVKDTTLVGHTTYYEDKPATESTGGETPDPVPMGSYDITVQSGTHLNFINVIQAAPSTGIGDSRYWGISATNWAKNMVFKGCSLSRIDAHCGFWGVDIIDTEIGHTINIIGGGRLYLENVTKLVGSSFISVRSDYGGTFRGDIIIIDCELMAANSYNSWRTQYNPASKASTAYVINVGYKTSNTNKYWDWDFGYDCYMPQNIVVENFKSGAAQTYLLPSFPDEVFTKANPLHKTESITFINMDPIPVCATPNLGEMNSIPVRITSESYNKDEQ